MFKYHETNRETDSERNSVFRDDFRPSKITDRNLFQAGE